MSEQNQEVTPEEVVEEKQYSAIELEAMEQGWRPKEEFQGDPDRFIEAGEFVRRGELFGKIDHQSKEIKQLKSTMEQFARHHANVEKVAYDRAIKDLKAQRKAALAEGDVDRFDELDNQIDEVTDERNKFLEQARTTPVTPTVNPAFSEWVARNPWYSKDTLLQGAADRFGTELARQGMDPLEVLKQVEKKIKEEFPHKFTNPNRERVSAVEAPAARGGSAKSRFTPTEEQKRIGQSFVRAGAFKDINDYYAELKKMEGKE